MPQDRSLGEGGAGELDLLAGLVTDLQRRLAGAEDKDAPGLVGALLKALERRAVVLSASAPTEKPGSISAVTRRIQGVSGG